MRIRAIWIGSHDCGSYFKAVTCIAPCWNRFRRHYAFNGEEARAAALAEWGARWVDDEHLFERHIDFESEKHATIFLLRWS